MANCATSATQTPSLPTHSSVEYRNSPVSGRAKASGCRIQSLPLECIARLGSYLFHLDSFMFPSDGHLRTHYPNLQNAQCLEEARSGPALDPVNQVVSPNDLGLRFSSVMAGSKVLAPGAASGPSKNGFGEMCGLSVLALVLAPPPPPPPPPPPRPTQQKAPVECSQRSAAQGFASQLVR